MLRGSYWGTLEAIRQMAEYMQRSPVPDAEVSEQGEKDRIDNERLVQAAFDIMEVAFGKVTKEVWVADPKDPARGDQPMAPDVVAKFGM